MQLGAFSISLAVKGIAASRAFYGNFGFGEFGRDASQGGLILKNSDHVIRLFQGTGLGQASPGDSLEHYLSLVPRDRPELPDG